ncbi:MAG: DNA mismatch repair protein MutS [Candidatus Coatesbacteria bacterium]|nr:MAG: DNA mismatch repair protein MutS [Candidatus Coatesbacteria bacterium]
MSTPMLKQYRAIKDRNADAIIFFRLGDFYEMFYDDAEVASDVLGLTLTGRGKGENRVPMCGFPHHAASGYVAKLLQAGYKVAVADQTEDPAQAKDLVRREVVRVITPGTVYEDELLDGAETVYLASLAHKRNTWAAARLDVAGGSFEVWPRLPAEAATALVSSWHPAETLAEEGVPLPDGGDADRAVVYREAPEFSVAEGTALLCDHFGVANLAGFGLEEEAAAVAAAAALLRYAAAAHLGPLTHVVSLKTRTLDDRMYLDATTVRNLEVFEHPGPGGGTLYELANRTRTAMGARLLRRYLAEPLLAAEAIDRRLEAVDHLLRAGEKRHRLRELLRSCGDLERLTGRVALGTANPRDVHALGRSLALVPDLRAALGSDGALLLAEVARDLVDVADLVQLVEEALADDPPATLTEGGIIRRGFRAELDDLRDRSAQAKEYIASLERTERERTGIASLKVGYNKVFGYYLEITKANLAKAPADYVRKQTLANAERFITPELKEYEDTALSADEKIAALEREIFVELRAELATHVARLNRVAAAMAQLDVLASFAQAALENDFARPEIVPEPTLEIEDGRHPVVERYYLDEPFVPNDLLLDERERFMILTGPNMAGKSTYLRQAALITLLAHAGSFVPARRAAVGLCDRIFTRIGAADDLSRGRSTFLVEMAEAAAIVNNASSRSLILLDEVGRGTSTYDGLSLAWAVSEYLAENVRARTLFATHYHELAALAEGGRGVVNYTVTVREAGGQVHFLRRVVRGVTSRSYGIQVARLAGLPPAVLARARQLLEELELGHGPQVLADGSSQQNLFAPRLPVLEEHLASLDPDRMTPREALEALYRLRALLERDAEKPPPSE